MKTGIQVLLVVGCAVGGFVGARRVGGGVGDAVAGRPHGATAAKSAGIVVNRGDLTSVDAVKPDGESAPPAAWTEAPRTFIELKAFLARAEGGGRGRLSVMEALGQMKADELLQLLSNEAENPDFFRRMAFDFQFAARRLAEMAPEKAAELWFSKGALRMQTEELLGPWARKDPQAFVAWSGKLTPEAQKATAVALGSIVKESPDQFVQLASQLSQSPVGTMAVRAAIDALSEGAKPKPDFAAARDFANRLPEGALRTAALAQLARWPGSDFSAYPEVVEAVASLPREDARRLGRDMAQHADTLPPSPARESAFMSALREQADRDMPAAVKRLESLVGTGDYPAAVRGFVEETSKRDPSAALQWALAIPQAEAGSAAQLHRSAALERAASELFKQNPDAARQWVETAPLSASEYFQLTGRARPR